MFLGLTMAESSINSDNWIYEWKWFLLRFYFNKSCHLSRYTLNYLIWRAFWRTFSNFPAFWTSLKFGFLVKHFVTFLISFSVWFFKIKLKTLPHLLNTGFTIVENGLFYGGEHLEAKICRFQTFLDKMAMFFEDDDAWKHFKYWLGSFNLL